MSACLVSGDIRPRHSLLSGVLSGVTVVPPDPPPEIPDVFPAILPLNEELSVLPRPSLTALAITMDDESSKVPEGRVAAFALWLAANRQIPAKIRPDFFICILLSDERRKDSAFIPILSGFSGKGKRIRIKKDGVITVFELVAEGGLEPSTRGL